MRGTVNCKDSYNAVFRDYGEMKAEIMAHDAASEWISDIVSNLITVSAVNMDEAGSIETDKGIPYDITSDTHANSHLMMSCNGKDYMLRDTAIPTLLETAKISGAALGRMPYDVLADVLNRCLAVSRGNSKLLYRGGKVCACLSENYKVMPITELLAATTIALRSKFGQIDFVEGENNYSLTTALWELPDALEEIMDKYDDMVVRHRKHLHDHSFMPAVRFITSDVGKCAATLIPLFKCDNGVYIRINDGIKVAHKGSGGVEAYEKEAARIYAKFGDIKKTMAAMADCEIEHPLNALVALCKKAGIPKRYASEAYEEIRVFAGGGSCFMDDIYMSIAGSMAVAERSGVTGIRLLNLEENIAKILTYDWKSFDAAGVVAW